MTGDEDQAEVLVRALQERARELNCIDLVDDVLKQTPRPLEELCCASDEHWRWRFSMAQRIAAQLDPVRFGVEALYLIGSAKNATAGPASDIDLLVHFRGNEQQRQQLMHWLEEWSRCLAEINFFRTGYQTDGLLDIHLITDEDIAARSSFASKIDALTDPARKLPLNQGIPGLARFSHQVS